MITRVSSNDTTYANLQHFLYFITLQTTENSRNLRAIQKLTDKWLPSIGLDWIVQCFTAHGRRWLGDGSHRRQGHILRQTLSHTKNVKSTEYLNAQ